MSISLRDDILNAVRESACMKTGCKTPKFRKPTPPPPPSVLDNDGFPSCLSPIQMRKIGDGIEIDVHISTPFNRDVEDAIIPALFKVSNTSSIDLKDSAGNIIATYYNAKEI